LEEMISVIEGDSREAMLWNVKTCRALCVMYFCGVLKAYGFPCKP
jgi:hypothetical protein